MTLCERLKDVRAHPRSTSAQELAELLTDAGFVRTGGGGGVSTYTHPNATFPVNSPDADPVYAGSVTPVVRAIDEVVSCDDH
jgi:hypothetical protein